MKVSLDLARQTKSLTPNVTIYTDGAEDLEQDIIQNLGGSGSGSEFKVDKRRITRLERGPAQSVIVHLEDRSNIGEGFLVSYLDFLLLDFLNLVVIYFTLP